jgi:hypothetical protein
MEQFEKTAKLLKCLVETFSTYHTFAIKCLGKDYLLFSIPKNVEELLLEMGKLVNKEFTGEELLNSYSRMQFFIDAGLKTISSRLHVLFKDEKKLRKKFLEMLGENAKTTVNREYLLDLLYNKERLQNEITVLKTHFNDIVQLAKELKFKVFDEQEYRYAWYRVLSLLRLEMIPYIQSAGIPEAFQKREKVF